MRFFFFLSGEHPTLPKSEVLASLEAIGARFRVLDDLPQVLVVEADTIEGLEKRLALTRAIAEFYGTAENHREDIISLAKDSKKGPLTDYAVRVFRINDYGREEFKTTDIEKSIGSAFYDEKSKVNLKNPREIVLGIISERFILGKLILNIDRASFDKRAPHKRVYFRPGSMVPTKARTMVNLARIKPGGKVADPFCGTGGFLIEAGLLGAKVYGFDIEEEYLRGAEKNLKHYKVKDYTLKEADATKLNELYNLEFDAVVTDPPYGISASTRGLTLEELYWNALKSSYELLKKDSYACMVAPEKIPLEKFAEKMHFKVEEVHFERVHKSLTRKIVVMRK